MTSQATPPPLEKRVGWVDQQLIQTNWFMLIALTALFFGLMWIFSGIGLLVGRHPVARKKAKILFTICTIYALFAGVMIYVLVQSNA